MDFVGQELEKDTARMVLLYPTMSGLEQFKHLRVGTAGARESTSKMASSFLFLALGL